MITIRTALARHDRAVAHLRRVEEIQEARLGLPDTDARYWALTYAGFAEHATADLWFAWSGGDLAMAREHCAEARKWQRLARAAVQPDGSPVWRLMFSVRGDAKPRPGVEPCFVFDVPAGDQDAAEESWRAAYGASYPDHQLNAVFQISGTEGRAQA